MAAAGRARALLHGRENVTYEDVDAVAVSVLCHRLVPEYHARLEGTTGVELAKILVREVPRHADPLPPLVGERDPA